MTTQPTTGVTFTLEYDCDAIDFLDTLVKKLQRQIVKKADALETNPFPAGCKQLADRQDGDAPVYRIRSGDYRVLYAIHDTTITILDIGHRKDVYR